MHSLRKKSKHFHFPLFAEVKNHIWVAMLSSLSALSCPVCFAYSLACGRDDDEKDVDEYIQDLVENCTSQQGEGEMLVRQLSFLLP